jgi:hypothetical protein
VIWLKVEHSSFSLVVSSVGFSVVVCHYYNNKLFLSFPAAATARGAQKKITGKDEKLCELWEQILLSKMMIQAYEK